MDIRTILKEYTKVDIPYYNDCFVRIVIRNKAYLLRFSYLKACDTWTFGIYDIQYNPIVIGIKIVPGIPLNIQYIDEALPPAVWAVKTKLDRVGYRDFWDGNAEFLYVEVPKKL